LVKAGVGDPFEKFCLAKLVAYGGGRHRKGKIIDRCVA
jgi:hypothetical protein